MTSGLRETGDRVNVLEPQEQWKTEEAGEASTLLGIMLTREGLLHIHHEVNMKKQNNISLKVDESTLAKDFADFIDENNATIQAIWKKSIAISWSDWIEQLRTHYN